MPRSPRSTLPQPVFDEPVFSQGAPTPDPSRFAVPHPSDAALYAQIQALLYEDAVGFPPSRAPPSSLYELAAALGPDGPELVQSIESTGRIVFHMAGDIGASTAGKYPGEIRVSDRLTEDCQSAPATDRPAFLYLLGDVVYDFGESQYYYDQFYEPYRNYPAPIFAIPGNHDSFIVPGTPSAALPLDTFQRNFCATEPVVTPEAGSLHRTAMTQPGVYFTLDAPFVRVIGLFSNALEDPGVISSQGGTWKAIPDYQLAFLTAQLNRVKSDGFTGAVLLAVHHPPFSYAPPAGGPGGGGPHGGNPVMLAQIDTICRATGVYPHAFISGHSHNYQRYSRSLRFGGGAYSVPFIVCGGGGHNVAALVHSHLGTAPAEPSDGLAVNYLDPNPVVGPTALTLERHDDRTYGYLRLTVDARMLGIEFYEVATGTAAAALFDVVTVDLASHTVVQTPPSSFPSIEPALPPTRGPRRHARLSSRHPRRER
ncbi:MAG: metallophosphoesterase family protein [Thermoplasmata archaeon]